MEEEKFKDEVDVHISTYISFIKRRKVCLAAAILIFLAAAYVSNILSPSVYRISTVIEPSSVETRMDRRITRREFKERANELLDELGPDIVSERDKRQIIMEFSARGEQNADSGLKIMDELLQEFRKYYLRQVNNERERLKRLIETRQAEKEKADEAMLKAAESSEHEKLVSMLTMLYNEILYLRSLFPEENISGLESTLDETYNIRVLEKPHISEVLEPRMNLSLAIGLISGIVSGIIIGAAKDITPWKKH